MSPAALVGIGAACWFAAAAMFGVLVGRAIHAAEHPRRTGDLCALVQPESWSQTAVDDEFQQLIPLMSREWLA